MQPYQVQQRRLRLAGSSRAPLRPGDVVLDRHGARFQQPGLAQFTPGGVVHAVVGQHIAVPKMRLGAVGLQLQGPAERPARGDGVVVPPVLDEAQRAMTGGQVRVDLQGGLCGLLGLGEADFVGHVAELAGEQKGVGQGGEGRSEAGLPARDRLQRSHGARQADRGSPRPVVTCLQIEVGHLLGRRKLGRSRNRRRGDQGPRDDGPAYAKGEDGHDAENDEQTANRPRPIADVVGSRGRVPNGRRRAVGGFKFRNGVKRRPPVQF